MNDHIEKVPSDGVILVGNRLEFALIPAELVALTQMVCKNVVSIFLTCGLYFSVFSWRGMT
jgi:hypothetical protein